MKEFRTALHVMPSPARFRQKNKVLTAGSCFSEAIGNRLALHKLNTQVNPFGVIYNPDSIHRALSYSIYNEPLPEHTYLQHQELYLNYNFHSAFSALKGDELRSRLHNTIGITHYFLKDTDWLLLTYGTAWVYRRKETGEIVANCHKLPASAFTRALLSSAEIELSFKTFYDALKKFNPEINIILTVSPVRHIKETLELNSVSKSVLRIACHNISQQYEGAAYFPAYEIMMDDLRDYRFYKPDMLHPTNEAEDYIWEKFMERYFSPEMEDFVVKWKEILSALSHKPFHPASHAHQQFLQSTLKKLEQVKDLVNVEEEVAWVRKQITN